MPARQARGLLGGDHRRFDRQRAGAAHRVAECRAFGGEPGPACTQQQRGRQIFLQRRLTAIAPVAALVQAAAAKVEADGGAFAIKVQMQADIGVFGVDRGPASAALAELVDDRVLESQRGEMRMRDAWRAPGHFDRQPRVHIEQGGPVMGERAFVEAFRVRCVHHEQRQQHARRGSRPQAGAIETFQIRTQGDPAATLPHVLSPQFAQLGGQQRFEAARSGDEGIEKFGLRHRGIIRVETVACLRQRHAVPSARRLADCVKRGRAVHARA